MSSAECDIAIENGCVIDPGTVGEEATFLKPIAPSEGGNHMIVNGQFHFRDDVLDANTFPGQPVRAPVLA